MAFLWTVLYERPTHALNCALAHSRLCHVLHEALAIVYYSVRGPDYLKFLENDQGLLFFYVHVLYDVFKISSCIKLFLYQVCKSIKQNEKHLKYCCDGE